MAEPLRPYTLIYDGTCAFCSAAADWVRDNTRLGWVECLPCQDEARARRFPQIPQEKCMEAVQLVSPKGRVYSGADVMPRILRLTPRWGALAWVFCLPGAGLAARAAYKMIARNRGSVSALLGLHCAHLDASCPRNGGK